MKEKFQNVKGMNDILPKDQIYWDCFVYVGKKISELSNFYYLETPIVERAELFEVGVGNATDIVEKEMYVFKTKGGDRVVLKPENTASVMRSYLQHQLSYFASPLKVYYFGPFFRYERPQAGRERQFHQWGFEIIGESDPVYDAEIILMILDVFNELKIKDIKVKINTIGCRSCRPVYRQKLKDFYKKRKNKLCKDCQRRYQKNVFRLLDCKEVSCHQIRSGAPIILDYLCQSCNNHFKGVLEVLEDNLVDYEPDPYLVRGLDYYNRTVFEFVDPLSKLEIAGGGRYDYLAEFLGDKSVPAVGGAIGVERVIEILKNRKINLKNLLKEKVRIFFVAVGDLPKKAAFRYIRTLKQAGFIVGEALGRKSLRAQLKVADKFKAKLALIFGQREFFEETIIIRDMESGVQENVLLNKLVEEVRKRLKM